MDSKEFINPLAFTSITDLLVAILNMVIIVSTPFVVLFIIYAGFLYVTAKGNPEQIRKASSALLYSIIGGVIIVGSVAIVAIVGNIAAGF